MIYIMRASLDYYMYVAMDPGETDPTSFYSTRP